MKNKSGNENEKWKKKRWRIKRDEMEKWGKMNDENIDEKKNMKNGKESWRNESWCGMERWKL